MIAFLRSSSIPAIVWFVAMGSHGALAADEAPPAKSLSSPLAAHDRQFLDRLLTEFIIDPQEAEFVIVPVKTPSAYGPAEELSRLGWRVAGKAGQPDRVFFDDGENIPVAAGTKIEKVDFIAACRQRYSKKPAAARDARESNDKLAETSRIAKMFHSPDLVVAAWLHRLGEDTLAVEALERAAEEPVEPFGFSRSYGERPKKGANDAENKMITAAKNRLAISAYQAMINAFTSRADEDALAHGQRLVKLYPEQAKNLNQAVAVYEDLKRRQKQGTLGKKPPEKLPDGFDSWDVPKKFAYLIDALDDLDSPRGEFRWERDRREEALIQLGEPIIPMLADTIENDERLTREVEYDRHFHVDESIVEVRRYAFSVARSILRVERWDPTDDSYYGPDVHDQANVKKVVAQLRAYWKANAGVPFDERMMKVLTNPNAGDDACREAAGNLISWENSYYVGPLGIKLRAEKGRPPDPQAAVAKFKNPTAAEAILAVLDRELAPHDPHVMRRGGSEVEYLGALFELHDKRMAPEFVSRYKAARKLHMRLFWAVAAHGSGDSHPLKELAGEFEIGKLAIPGEDLSEKNTLSQMGTTDLRDLIDCLVRVDLPETERALAAVANPKHSFHDRIAAKIDENTPGGFHHDDPYLEHPFCLAFFRRRLDDNTPTGATYAFSGDSLDIHGPQFGIGGKLPDFLLDPATRRQSAPELASDRAAVLINELVFGMPLVYPLRLDHDDRLREMKALMDRYQGRFRRIGRVEGQLTGWQISFIADIGPLNKPATADDLNAGRAIFNLAGKASVAAFKLPASGSLKTATAVGKPQPVLIVQAEIDAAGKTHFGIIGRHIMREAAGDELTDVKPLAPADASR